MENIKKDEKIEKSAQDEVFSEIALFGEQSQVIHTENSDCGCNDCDGNPCVKVTK